MTTPWFQQDAQGRYVPTGPFIEHTLALVGQERWDSPRKAGLYLANKPTLFNRLLREGGAPAGIITARMAGCVDKWFTGYEAPIHAFVSEREERTREVALSEAWAKLQLSKGIKPKPAPPRRPAWGPYQKKWPAKLRSTPIDTPHTRFMSVELSLYLLKSTCEVMFPGRPEKEQLANLAELLRISRRTILLWQEGRAMHSGLYFKALAVRVLASGNNIRLYRDTEGNPIWSTMDWSKVGTYTGERLYRLARRGKMRPPRSRSRERAPGGPVVIEAGR